MRVCAGWTSHLCVNQAVRTCIALRAAHAVEAVLVGDRRPLYTSALGLRAILRLITTPAEFSRLTSLAERLTRQVLVLTLDALAGPPVLIGAFRAGGALLASGAGLTGHRPSTRQAALRLYPRVCAVVARRAEAARRIAENRVLAS